MPDPLRIAPIAPRPVNLESVQTAPARPTTVPAPSTSFKEVLSEAMGEVKRLQNEADTTIRRLVAGEIKDVAEAMVAVERADVAFQTMMLVRNKMVAAYEEIMRMQV